MRFSFLSFIFLVVSHCLSVVSSIKEGFYQKFLNEMKSNEMRRDESLSVLFTGDLRDGEKRDALF